MMSTNHRRMLDISGQRFGSLTAIRFTEWRLKRSWWLCKCDCGAIKEIPLPSLRRGDVKSCGCLYQVTRRSNVKHDMHSSPEYRVYHNMKHRCLNPKLKAYKDYGAKGIKVCPRWLESFENFLEDMGPRPSAKHSIDRFPDPFGNYEPSNCRWATWSQQMNNTRTACRVKLGGVKNTLAQWAKEKGLSVSTIYYRIKHGYSPEDAINTPLHNGRTQP